jgi:DNA sulfur modification protein DndD
MKLKSAKIKNFKLLRDVRIEFSDDPLRPLTVIRAENGSGKTSTLMALRWALYGEKGLGDPTMRLSPTSWPSGQDCEVSVQLDFSHTLYSVIAGESVGTTTDYRLLRSVTERPEGNRPNRGADRPTLYQYGDSGLDKKNAPELLIEDMLPIEMKDIFFTDGDAALTFISPQLGRATKSNQVREAIRSLLGLGLLENVGFHIAEAKKRFNSGISKLSGSAELADITRRLTEAEDGESRDTRRLRDVERQIEDLARRYEEADKRLQLALQAGDYEEVVREQNRARAQLKDAKDNEQPLKERHQQLLQDERLSLVMLGSVLDKGFGELAKLHDAGVIPSGSVPVLEERLDLGVCICGTPLTEGSEARQHVKHLISAQRTVDDKRKVLTELHHAAKVDLQRGENAASSWIVSVNSLEKTRLNNRKAMASAEDELKVCQEKIRRIDKAKINEARKDRDSLLTSSTAKQDERRDLQTYIDKWQSTIDELTPQQNQLRRQDQKLAELNSRLTVTEDMALVVRGALEDLQQIYLARVSERLNSLFLEMVGADPASMAHLTEGDGDRKASQVIASAAITSNYEIVVNSNHNTTLNPDHELSGAQKRALTFAFIWALTEVSQVVAPRIIDTPLGMMSGLVKRRVLELITSPSRASDAEKQVVLFLTRDEIRGIESVVDARAGRIITFTNSDHYPVDVVSNPGLETPEILKCECSHRQWCRVCARRNDHEYGLVERPVV